MKKITNKKKKKTKLGFFISDNGYGHVIRQSSIIKELLSQNKNKKLEIYVFGNKILQKIKNEFKNKIYYRKVDNVIKTKKNLNGSLSLGGTKKIFSYWKDNKENLIKKTKNDIKNFKLIITDSVPHVIDAANDLGIKVLNISHYTWDWFYYKTFKKDDIYEELFKSYKNVHKFISPPLTDTQILKTRRNKIRNINFIVTDSFIKKKIFELKKNKKLRCVIMDNGSKVLSSKIMKIIKYLKDFDDLSFVICGKLFPKKLIMEIKKIKYCKIEYDFKLIHRHISSCDFLIARGGYNTISECLILKKPTLLYNETKNKEVEGNIKHLKKKGLTYPIYKEFFTHSFKENIDYFISHKLKKINRNFLKYNFKGNGSKQASKIIMSCLF